MGSHRRIELIPVGESKSDKSKKDASKNGREAKRTRQERAYQKPRSFASGYEAVQILRSVED